MKLVLVRHGRGEGNALSDHGSHQIEKIAKALELRRVAPSLYVSSSASAAVASCEQIAKTLASVAGIVPSPSKVLTPPPAAEGTDGARRVVARVKAWLQSWTPGRGTAQRGDG